MAASNEYFRSQLPKVEHIPSIYEWLVSQGRGHFLLPPSDVPAVKPPTGEYGGNTSSVETDNKEDVAQSEKLKTEPKEEKNIEAVESEGSEIIKQDQLPSNIKQECTEDSKVAVCKVKLEVKQENGRTYTGASLKPKVEDVKEEEEEIMSASEDPEEASIMKKEE